MRLTYKEMYARHEALLKQQIDDDVTFYSEPARTVVRKTYAEWMWLDGAYHIVDCNFYDRCPEYRNG